MAAFGKADFSVRVTRFGASNRLRRFATNLSASRSVATYPQLILQLPATGNVSGLLDAILTARFPDPVERAQQVQDLIDRQAFHRRFRAGSISTRETPMY